MTREELLLFVYATIEPFIGDQAKNTTRLQYDGDDYEETLQPISVTRKDSLLVKVQDPNAISSSSLATVVEWRPSALLSSIDSSDALHRKKKAARDLRLVQDGANAPKLTGSARHGNRNGSYQVQTLNLPANIQAVLFGLNLLQSALKRFKRFDDDQGVNILDPFVHLLTTCACYCRDTDIVLISLRCLILMLPMRLPSTASCTRLLGTKALDILGSSGGTSQVQSETAQASFKLMTLLMKLDNDVDEGNSEVVSKNTVSLIADDSALASGIVPLDSEQMTVLLSIVQGAIVESGQHNQALGLISALVSRRFISPEFYDLLEKVLELSVRSHSASVRLVSVPCPLTAVSSD
jgi:U3 small nucleolar RNA-associated protein 20